MAEKADRHFGWWFGGYAALGLLAVFLVCVFVNVLAAFLFFWPAVAGIAFGLSAFATDHRQHWRPSVLAILVIFCAASWVLFEGYTRHYPAIRPAVRWMLWSKTYKAEVLAQPPPANRQYRHLEWDSWGINTSGTTTVYLVFDPENALHPAVQEKYDNGFFRLPNGVAKVERLEDAWYAVTFFAGCDWDHDVY